MDGVTERPPQGIDEIAAGRWLDEPLDLDDAYGKPEPGLYARLRLWMKERK